MQEKSEGYAWRNFTFVLLVGISYSISLMVVPMYMQGYMQVYGNDASLLMTYTSISGTLIAFFTAGIQSKIGPKTMVILSAVCQIIGDIVMVMNLPIAAMFAGRFVLGLGNGLVATAAPSLVSALWHDPQKRGVPTAVWTMWIGLGAIIISFLVVPLGSSTNAFIFATVLAVIVLVCAIFFITIPKEEQMKVVAGNENVRVSDAFKSPWVILCFLMILCFAFTYSCFTTYSAMYLMGNLGPVGGSSMNAAGNFIGIAAGLVIGIIFRKSRKHPLILLVVFVLSAIAAITVWAFTGNVLIIVTAVFFFIVYNIMVPCVFNNVQWASPDPSVIGASFGLMAIASNAGGMPAAPVVGAIYLSTGSYFQAMVPGMVVAAVGLVCAIIFYVGRRKYVAEAFAQRDVQADTE